MSIPNRKEVRRTNVRLARGTGNWQTDFLRVGVADGHPDVISIIAEKGDVRSGNPPFYYHSQSTITFENATGNILIRESWCLISSDGKVKDPNKYIAATARLIAGSFTIVVFGPSPNKATDYILRIKKKDGGIWEVINIENVGLAKELEKNLSLVRCSEFDKYRRARFTFFDATSNGFFDIGKISQIIKPLSAESEERTKQLEGLGRGNCRTKIERNEKFPRKMVLKVESNNPNDDWVLEPGLTMGLSASELFVEDTAHMDGDGRTTWSAKVIPSAEKSHTAIVENSLDPSHEQFFGKVIKDVKVRITDDDPMADRQSAAVRIMGKTFERERGELTREMIAEEPRCQLRIPVTPLFVGHPDYHAHYWEARPLSFQNPSTTLDSIKQRYQLEDSHVRAVNKIQQGKGGVACIIGAPGTGKTTLFAKIAAILLELFSRKAGSIVMTANTDATTAILLEKCVEEFSKLGLNHRADIVWVETPSSRNHRKHAAREVNPALDYYHIDNRALRLAQSDPELYAPYLRGLNLQKTPEGMEKEDAKQFFKCREMIYDTIKKKARVFICTVSTCRSPFFVGSELGTGQFPVDILMVDEASQLIWPDLFEAVQVCNMSMLILAGDDKQLEPYTRSVTAQQAWKNSPIAVFRRRAPEVTELLDIQFRMPHNLYYPTSAVHYDGRVTSHQSTVNRPFAVAMREKLRKIEIDCRGDGNYKRLGHNFAVFSIDGTQTRAGSTSSQNVQEAVFINHLTHALWFAGFDEKDMMALTGYTGQYQLIDAVRQGMAKKAMAVRKIDASQGAEAPITVFSGVSSQYIGFMKSTQRQNVGTSRQREALFMVMKMNTFKNSETCWAKWWDAICVANNEGGRTDRWFFNIGPGYYRFRVNGQLSVPPSIPNLDKCAPSDPKPKGEEKEYEEVGNVSLDARENPKMFPALGSSPKRPAPQPPAPRKPAGPKGPVESTAPLGSTPKPPASQTSAVEKPAGTKAPIISNPSPSNAPISDIEETISKWSVPEQDALFDFKVEMTLVHLEAPEDTAPEDAALEGAMAMLRASRHLGAEKLRLAFELVSLLRSEQKEMLKDKRRDAEVARRMEEIELEEGKKEKEMEMEMMEEEGENGKGKGAGEKDVMTILDLDFNPWG